MAPTRPNIIFIMADDHASKAISAYGAGINHTPNIDRLATEGMMFKHAYVTNSICTPSRAAILTGMHNHVNGVTTLGSKINTELPNVAKQLRTGGYQTAMVGKWHLGEGASHQPSGFDYWSVVPGQGDYWDPEFIEADGSHQLEGYATDIITEKTLNFIKARDKSRPFFAMCHHKAPHRSWECHDKHKHLYTSPVKVPETFTDDYKNRAKAAKIAKMRVADDLTYFDLGLCQPDGGSEKGEKLFSAMGISQRKIPAPTGEALKNLKLIDKEDGTVFTFETSTELAEFKFQRYMQRYLRTIQSIDDSVGEVLDYLKSEGLDEKTVIIYSSDQGFFLGEHGWFDKRFMYEESFQMPFLIRYPPEIKPGTVCDDIVQNVDFAPLFLDFARLKVPNYMQGTSFRPLLRSETPKDWQQVAFHHYVDRDWIHNTRPHYGIRDQRFKLIFWFRLDGPEDQEWELFDCDEDRLELFNVYADPKFVDVVTRMTILLEKKMAQIGVEPIHTSNTLEESFRVD
ncbi:hypothetical protein VMCG_06003 [Cytospora schulzeri]|uniref:Sulfatase N-terminal domain-containing protein n=1 Tax=Cytospora schulzeri TaxID=448051 RepID=A0A423WGN8_9PEZI|nr:hypothetical protein VMCG_06003 [Valsa malicola]